jgi:hypothetical protein
MDYNVGIIVALSRIYALKIIFLLLIVSRRIGFIHMALNIKEESI